MKYLAAIVVIVVAVVVMAGLAYYVITTSHPGAPPPSVLNVSLRDAGSTSFTKALVVVSKVEVHKAKATNDTGWSSLALQTSSFDLLKLSSNVTALLGSGQIDPGNYTEVRVTLKAINATVASNGTTVKVYLYQTTLLAEKAFVMNASQVVGVLLELDLARSFVLMPWGQWYFLPVLGATVVTKS